MKVSKLFILPLIASFAMAATSLESAISITDTSFSYSQDFNGLPLNGAARSDLTWTDNSTLPGWYRRANVNNTDQTPDPHLKDYTAKGRAGRSPAT